MSCTIFVVVSERMAVVSVRGWISQSVMRWWMDTERMGEERLVKRIHRAGVDGTMNEEVDRVYIR